VFRPLQHGEFTIASRWQLSCGGCTLSRYWRIRHRQADIFAFCTKNSIGELL
jgi:hypothetical protein